MKVEDINLLDRDVFAEGVPHEWFTYLRHNRPILHHPEPHGPGFWVVSKHADVQAVTRDPSTYSSDPVVPLEDVEPSTSGARAKILLMMDPADHTKFPRLVNRAFTPRTISALESRIREITVRILDQAIAMGSCDFVMDIALELPMQV